MTTLPSAKPKASSVAPESCRQSQGARVWYIKRWVKEERAEVVGRAGVGVEEGMARARKLNLRYSILFSSKDTKSEEGGKVATSSIYGSKRPNGIRP